MQKQLNKNVHYISSSEHLKTIIRSMRQHDKPVKILFGSLWDRHFNLLVDKINDSYKRDIFIVTTWDTPEVFSEYGVTKAPCLLTIVKGKVFACGSQPLFGENYMKEDFLPRIYRLLRIK